MKAILSPVARLLAPLAMFAALLSCESGNKSQTLTQWTCGETTVNSTEIKVDYPSEYLRSEAGH